MADKLYFSYFRMTFTLFKHADDDCDWKFGRKLCHCTDCFFFTWVTRVHVHIFIMRCTRRIKIFTTSFCIKFDCDFIVLEILGRLTHVITLLYG